MRRGRRLAGRKMTIHWRPTELDAPRLGMNIAKRFLPRAVDRNRVKRLLREELRIGAASRLGGVDVVVSLRAGRGDAPDWDLAIGQEFCQMLGRIATSRR